MYWEQVIDLALDDALCNIHQDLMLQRVAESYEAARVFFRSLIVRDSHIDSTQDSYGYGSIPINTIFIVG